MKTAFLKSRQLCSMILISAAAFQASAQVIGDIQDAGESELKKIVDLSQLQSGGNGCPGGGALEIYQSDFSGRTMIFLPEMKVDVTSKGLDRKACALALAVSLPVGKRLVIGQPAVFGQSQLASGASVIAMAEVFEAGGTGPKVQEDLSGVDGSTDYFYQRGADEVRTACGASLNLRANVSILAKKGASAGGTAMVEGAALTLQIEDCEVDAGTIEIAE